MARALLCRKVCVSHRAPPRVGLCFGGLAEPLAAASVAVVTDDARCVALGGCVLRLGVRVAAAAWNSAALEGFALRLGVRVVVRAAARDASASGGACAAVHL